MTVKAKINQDFLASINYFLSLLSRLEIIGPEKARI